METKKCFKCGRELPITDFYKHPQMSDGYLNKCKECTRKDVRKNYDRNIQNEAFIERERARCRDKYRRLYSPKGNNPRFESDPITRHIEGSNTRRFYRTKGIDIGEAEFHHWNYNLKNSVFVLCHRAHILAHKYLTFDRESGLFFYNGKLLKTKEDHRRYLEAIFKEEGYSIVEYDL